MKNNLIINFLVHFDFSRLSFFLLLQKISLTKYDLDMCREKKAGKTDLEY